MAVARWYLHRVAQAYLRQSAAYARLNGTITESVEGARTVDALGLGARRCARVDADLREAFAAESATLGLRMRLIPGANTALILPVLAVLKTRYRLGVITNGPSDLQRTKLARSGLDAWFPVQVISREVGVAKPDPRIFAIALERLGVTAAEAVYVGDSPKHDIEGAHASGIKAVWLQRDGAAGIKPVAQGGGVESENVPADAVIHTLAELVPLLDSL